MFVLTSIKQTVRVPAHCFRLDLDQAIGEELNKKYANKVVLNVGLCIALWDIEKREESYILPGDGGSHTKVHFRFVVFRPFMEQILIGKIKNSSRQGVQISLGFFDDVWMPAENLQHPSRFDEAEHLWAWEYENDEGKHELFMDVGAEVRFRVVAETFSDTTPSGPGGDGPAPGGQDAADLHDNHIRRTPYLLTVASVILDLFFLHERSR